MGATINDFSGPVVNLSGTGSGSLTATGLTANNLVIAAAADNSPNGIAPNIKWGGMKVKTFADLVSTPYRSSFYTGRYLYPYYWYGYWWGWRYWYLLGLEARIMLGFTQEAGTLEAEFAGNGIVDTAVKVYTPNVVVDDVNKEALETINASQSAKRSNWTRFHDRAFIDVVKDDLVVAIGRDDSYNWAQAQTNFFSGPGVQELFNWRPQMTRKSIAVKIWRVQADGTLGVQYDFVSRERMLAKFSMNATLKTVVLPADPPANPDQPPRIFFEVETVRDAQLKQMRANWFNALADSQRGNESWGKLAGFTKETLSTQQDDLGRERAGQWKEIEIFGVDPAAKSSIDISEAKVFDDVQELNARLLQLEGRI